MKKLYTITMAVVFAITAFGQNKLLSSIRQGYNDGNWQIDGGDNYEYDSKNNLITETELNWNSSTNRWENAFKSIYTYNANNKVTEAIIQEWNETTKLFENKYRDIYTYNSNGFFIGYEEKKWEASQWVNDFKSDLLLNNNNLIISYSSYGWINGQWVKDSRGTLSYNANNKVVSEISESWIDVNWVNDYRSFYSYNANNKISTEIHDEWVDNSWKRSGTLTNNYDANGNIDFEIDDYSVGQEKEKNYYDTSAQMANFVHPFKDKTGIDYLFYQFPYINKILSKEISYYDNTTSTFKISSKTTYNYTSSIILGTDEIEKNNVIVKIYPNPSKDYIQVTGLTESENFEVYSVLGTLAIKGSIAENQKIDIKNLANGVYLLKLNNGNTLKFIKE